MTIAADPKLLAQAVSMLKSIPDRSLKVPVAGMLHLEPAEGGMTITATDMDIEVSVRVACEADFAPACLPPYLIETAAKLAGERVEIAMDERTATVKSGRARFTAPVMRGDDFPRAGASFDTRLQLPGKTLGTLIDATLDAVDENDPRHYLQGVFVETDGDDRLRAVATNGHRLQTVSAQAAGRRLAGGIIVPVKAAREMARIAGRAGDGEVALDIGAASVALAGAGETMTGKLIEGTYPDWRRVLPEPSGVAATFDLAEMVAALDRIVRIMDVSSTAKAADKPKLGTAIRLAEDGDWLTISGASAHSAAEATDAVKAEFRGAWGVHGVSSKYLLATLADIRARGADTVSIDSKDAGAPLRIESVTDEDFLAIVMPMRVLT